MKLLSRKRHLSFFIWTSVFVAVLALLVGCEPNSEELSPPTPAEPTVPGSASPARLPSPLPDTEHSDNNIVALREALKSLRLAQVVFNTPTQMRVAETELVEMRLSDDLKRDLKTGLRGKIETAEVKVSWFMKARLEGTNFNIKSLTEESQALAPESVARWRWNVTPTESGEQKLFFTLYARIKLPNQQEEVVDLKTFERDIKVAVNPSNWLEQNGKGIIDTAIALGGAGFFAFLLAKWKLIRRWSKNKIAQSKDTTPKQ